MNFKPCLKNVEPNAHSSPQKQGQTDYPNQILSTAFYPDRSAAWIILYSQKRTLIENVLALFLARSKPKTVTKHPAPNP
jgi:hypothetical protein